MRKIGMLALATLFAATAIGCQCCSHTETYGDFIDDVNDHGFCMDRFYRAEWDLTRIGHSDWCQSEFNRKWCGLGCQGNCDAAAACDECPPVTFASH